VLVGPLAVEAFRKIHADVAVMSAGGLTLEGVTNSHGLLIDIQRAMIEAGQRVILCLDHTKWPAIRLSLCDLDCINVIVTDSGAPRELLDALRERGMEVVVADQGNLRRVPGLGHSNERISSKPSCSALHHSDSSKRRETDHQPPIEVRFEPWNFSECWRLKLGILAWWHCRQLGALIK